MPRHRDDRPAGRRRRVEAAQDPARGRRRGGAHVLERPPGRLRVATPGVAAAAVLTLGTVGALTGVGSSRTDGTPTASEGADAVVSAAAAHPGSTASGSTTDTEAMGRLLAGRERKVSRDSQRTALEDAADEGLQAVTAKQARARTAGLAKLAASAEKQAGKLAQDGWQLPVTPPAYHLTSRFGQCSSLWAHCHTGLDFAAPTGTPIHAVASGTISETGSAGAYGNRTIETLPDGTELWYCHQSAFGVRAGQKVVAGQMIGAVGATGNTTGPHVHLEVRPGAGDPVDPFAALVAHGLKP